MSSQSAPTSREIDMLRHQSRMVRQVVHLNVDGLTQEETLIQPQPDGNCLNWVVGHLLAIYHHALPLLSQEPVLPASVLQRYDRGSMPIRNAADAMNISTLLTAWDECCRRIDAGLADLPLDRLDAPAPTSPTNNPDETVGSLLNTVCWHQAYHSGQTGILRRLADKPGAIK